jgi:hypothetical protein
MQRVRAGGSAIVKETSMGVPTLVGVTAVVASSWHRPSCATLSRRIQSGKPERPEVEVEAAGPGMAV